jgi:uncharacterized protein (TIGR02118 family)
MIHQLIFAAPKPGMSEPDFQKYWVEVHAVNYASKIPQIKRYLIDTRLPLPGEKGEPVFSGAAEIWLKDEKEQLESLQTKEFLEGARPDEPRWAAFWKTLVLDTDAHVLLDGPPPTAKPTWVKTMTLWRRKEGLPLGGYRAYGLRAHSVLQLQIPGLRRCLQCHTRDSWYGLGEPRFDGVSMLWFDDLAALQKAQASSQYQACQADLANFLETRHLLTLVAQEHWIIGPHARA